MVLPFLVLPFFDLSEKFQKTGKAFFKAAIGLNQGNMVA